MKSHKVKSGENMTKVLKQHGVDPKRAKEIAKYNGIKNEHLIYEGQVIKIPSEPEVPGGGGATPNPGGSGQTPPKPAGGAKGGANGGVGGKKGAGPGADVGKGTPKPQKPSEPHKPPKKTKTPSKKLTQTQKFVDSLSDSKLFDLVYFGRGALAFGRKSESAAAFNLDKLSRQELTELMNDAEQLAFDRQIYRNPNYVLYTEDRAPVKGTEPRRSGVRLTRAQLRQIQIDAFQKK